MPLPLLAAAAPWILSAVGSMLPAIVDAFRSGKSPEEAQKIIAPHRKEIVDRLVGTGMNQTAAEAMADQSMQGEFEKAQLPEPMNPWLQGALAIGGGIAGYKGGKMLAGKLGAKVPPVASRQPTAEPPKEPVPEAMETSEAGEPAGLQDEVPRLPMREVQAEVMSGPFPSPQMDRRFATDWISPPRQMPSGMARGRGFTMQDAQMGPFPRLPISPELNDFYQSGLADAPMRDPRAPSPRGPRG